ncbi:MAG: Asp-tRNA(Asn)/Glu-tRNA(Gln) amidotransferase subunit GatC [Tissierellia bacterium]|nr:Asp-tRNA(Asn)/Glu-tRNA(Gln) amidotransferase subunit GatC [Tissierellia bacterium]
MKHEEVAHIAEIAMLKFSEDTLEGFADVFIETMEFMDRIKNVDTKDTEGVFHVVEKDMPLREDTIVEGLSQKDATKNTKSEKYGYFEILPFVE